MKEISLYFLLGALILSLALGDGEVRGNQDVSNYKRTLAFNYLPSDIPELGADADGFEYDSGISTVSKSSKKSSKKTSKKTSKKSSSGKGGSRSSSSSDDVDDNDGNSNGGKFENFISLYVPVDFFLSHIQFSFRTTIQQWKCFSYCYTNSKK